MEIKELENKIKELQEEIKKLKKKENKRWRAEGSETYYFIDCNNEVYSTVDSLDSDEKRYYMHNYFKSKEEAQTVADNIKTHIELMEIAEELNTEPIDWENYEQKKYFINYNYDYKEIYTGFYGWVKTANVIYCTNSNFKDEAIKRIGEERLVRYLKGE